MTSLIEDYEQQYSILTAEITAEIGRFNRVTGDDKKELNRKINSSLEEVQELLEQIGLEIRDADTTTKGSYINRLNCYQAELKRLKQEFVNVKNQKLSDNTAGSSVDGQSLYDSFDFDDGVKDEQQRRLLHNSDRIERAGNRLADGYRTILETEQIGTAVLQDLSQQRETLQRSRSRLREANEDLSRSSRLMNSLIMRSLRERAALYGIVFIFLFIISLSIYFSFSGGDN